MLPPKRWNNHGAFPNIGLFSIAHCKVIALYLFCLIFGIIYLLLTFLWFHLLHYSDSCCSFSLLKAIAISISLLFTIAFKSKKINNYCCWDSWKCGNYTESNTEKKPWINVQNQYKKRREVKSDNFGYFKVKEQ